jgi:hypothetical protein
MRDAIEMAREADEYADMEWPLRPRGEGWQKCRDERFEALVRAAEREACAVIAETPIGGEQDDITMQAKDRVAAAIRARGETK